MQKHLTNWKVQVPLDQSSEVWIRKLRKRWNDLTMDSNQGCTTSPNWQLCLYLMIIVLWQHDHCCYMQLTWPCKTNICNRGSYYKRPFIILSQCTPKKSLLDKMQHTALQQFGDISKLNSQADLYWRQTCNDVKCSEIPSYSSITQQYSLLSIQLSWFVIGIECSALNHYMTICLSSH